MGLLVFAFMVPAADIAQSEIADVVTDGTGGVLPGVMMFNAKSRKEGDMKKRSAVRRALAHDRPESETRPS